MNSLDKYSSGEYQRKIADFVQREVIYCVSSLISELAKSTEFPEYQEELYSVCCADDYETAAIDDGWQNGLTDKFGVAFFKHDDGSTWAGDNWQDLCQEFDIDPHQTEAYEHWIVSEWFANKLESKGEMIARDLHGLTVWGRTTTGQSISMDRVICDIYDELNIQ